MKRFFRICITNPDQGEPHVSQVNLFTHCEACHLYANDNNTQIKTVMKKFIIFTLAAIFAAVTLSSATVNLAGGTSDGTVRFESTAMPALNFTMPVSRATDIYRLMPESITALCGSEYEAVRAKSFKSTSFTHQGVTVKRTGENPSMTFTFSVPGYRVIVSNVSWDDLDLLFIGTADRI